MIKFKHIKRLGSDQSGMTLIDMAIFLIVIGLLTVPLIKGYDAWKYSHAKGTTTNNLGSINKAIADYYYTYGYYPCPARIDAAPDDPDYGIENCAGTTAGALRTGAAPLVTLKIPPETALDGWSNRIKYTVAKTLSGSGTPAFGDGAITGITVLRYHPSCTGAPNAPTLDAHFLLISTGPAGMGGTTADGQQISACTTGANAPLEATNCDGDLTFRSDICARSDRNDQSYYDDVTLIAPGIPQRMWVYSTATGATGLKDPADIISTIPQIGINNSDPFTGTSQAGVDVIGNVTTGDGTPANPGAIVSDTICDANGQNCFSPSLIGGPATIMNDCTKNYSFGMRGIGNIPETGDNRAGARVRCQSTFTPSAYNLCAPKYAIGFAGGKIKCAP